MADFNIERVGSQNTVFSGQTGNKATEAGVSSPIDMGAGKKLPDGPLAEKLQRKKELQAILQQKIRDIENEIQQIKTNYGIALTDPRCAASKGHVEKMIAEKQTELTEVKAQFAQLEQNTENLPEEEYNKYFQSAFGMEPDEYRMESEQNPDFKIKKVSVDKIKTTNAALDNKNNHTAKEIQQRQGGVIQQRAAENKAVKQGLDDAKDNQGVIRKGCNYFVNHSHLFSSTEDSVLSAIGQDEKDIEELNRLAQNGDDIGFNTKYKQMTGVDFRIGNFEKIEEAQKKSLLASDTKKIVDTSKNLNKKNDNYSLDYFEKDKIYDPKNPPKASPLETAMFEYFGGKKNAQSASRATQTAINNAIKNLGLENADPKTKYETLQKKWIDIVEDRKKNFPDYNNEKKYKQEYEKSVKNAYGNNIAKDKLNNYVSNVETTYGLAKTAAIIGATVATGGAGGILGGAAVAAGTGAVINTIEETTDKDGLTKADAKRIGIGAAVDFGAFAIGGAVAQKAGTAIVKSADAAMKAGETNLAVEILCSRTAMGGVTGAAMGSTAGAVSGAAETILNTPLEELSTLDILKNSGKGAVSGGIFGGLFGAAMGKIHEWTSPKDLAINESNLQQKTSIQDLKTKLMSSDNPELRALGEKVSSNTSKADLAKIKLEVAKRVHPDVGGSNSLMAEYNALFDSIAKGTPQYGPRVTPQSDSAQNTQTSTQHAAKPADPIIKPQTSEAVIAPKVNSDVATTSKPFVTPQTRPVTPAFGNLTAKTAEMITPKNVEEPVPADIETPKETAKSTVNAEEIKAPEVKPDMVVEEVKTSITETPKADPAKAEDVIPAEIVKKDANINNNRSLNNFLETSNTEALKSLDIIIEKYGKQGLPLEYSRADFIRDLNAKLEALPESQRADIIKRLDIQIKSDTYDGLINLKGLDTSVKEQAEIQELCERFLLNNRVNTGDAQTDKLLNSIIHDIPEFVNIIGKPQHRTHKYSLDGHTLKVLEEVVSNSKFEGLSAEDKKVAILTSLLHDIGKKSGVIDKGHEITSSTMAEDILKEFNLPESDKTRIVELIKNHNWLEMINTGRIDAKMAATIFKTPEDLTIAEIFAEADLKSVGNGFGERYLSKIKPAIEKIRAVGNTSKPALTIDEKMQIIWGDRLSNEEMNNPILRQNTDVLFELLKEKDCDCSSYIKKNLSTRRFDVSPENFEGIELDCSSSCFARALSRGFPVEVIESSGKAKKGITGVEEFVPEFNFGEDKDYGKSLVEWYQDTTGNSGAVNKALRKSEPLSEKAQEVVDFLDTHQRPLGRNRGLIRGTNDFPGMEFSKMQPGDEFTDLGFSSTTHVETFPDFIDSFSDEVGHDSKHFLIIRTPANQKVIVPSDWTGTDNMGEIILPRGTRFRVLENKPLHDFGTRCREPIEGRRAIVVEIVPDTPAVESTFKKAAETPKADPAKAEGAEIQESKVSMISNPNEVEAVVPRMETSAVESPIIPIKINPNSVVSTSGKIAFPKVKIESPSLDLLGRTVAADSSQSEAVQNPETVKTDIFYINDVHGQIPMMERLVTAAERFDEAARTKGSDTLKVSAGDIMLGENPQALKTSAEFLKRAGIDLATMGNHEMDGGFDAFKRNIKDTETLFLGTNMNFPSGSDDRIVLSSIREINGNRYGFLGIQPSEITERLKDPTRMAGVTIDDINQTILELQEHINELKKQGVDKIILLSHAGNAADKLIAANTEGLDVIIGGHSHDLIKGVTEGNNLVSSKNGEPVVITQAGHDGENFGVLSLEFDKDGIIKTAQNSVYDTREFESHSDMRDFVYEQFGRPEIIGKIERISDGFRNTLVEENPYADFMLDSVRKELGTDIALLNTACLRGTLNTGELTDKDISGLVPFKNKLVKVYLSEKELVDALKFGAKSINKPDHKPGLLQCSGIKYKVNNAGELVDLVIVDSAGNKIRIDVNNPSTDKKYLCAYNDFLANGGDGFSMLKKINDIIEYYGFDIDTATINYIKSISSPISFSTDRRIQIAD